MSAVRVVPVDAAERERRRERRVRAAWVAGAAVLSLAITVQPFGDGSAWWQLALGRVIAAHGLPTQEPFSFLPAAHAWVGQGWLFEVLLAGLVGAGGFGLASVVAGVAATTGLVLAALSVPRSARVTGPWLAAAMVLSALVASQTLGVDGAAVSLLGAGAVLHVLGRWREGGTTVVWLLPPLFLLWANMDSGFVIGLAIIVIALLVARRRRAAAAAQRTQLALALAVSVVATLVNPYGPGIYSAIVSGASDPAVAALSPAFASPDFHQNWLRLFEVEAVLLAVCWIAGGGPEPFDAVLGFAALGLALWSEQFVFLFAVVAVPQVARYAERAWQLRFAARVRATLPRAPRLRLVAAGAAAAVLVAGVTVALVRQVTPEAAAAYEGAHFPMAAARYVAAHFGGQRLYSTDTWGGYLAYRFPTGRVVFLYDQGDTFGDAAVRAYTTVHLLQDGWEEVIRNEGIGHAVVGDTSQEASALHELGWTVSCSDAASGAVVMSAPAAGEPATAAAPLTAPPTGAVAC